MKRCFPLFHKYSKWETAEEGHKTREGRVKGFYIRQVRTCERCGKTQMRIEQVGG